MSKETKPSGHAHRHVAMVCLALTLLTALPFSLISTTLAAPASAITWESGPTDLSGGRSFFASPVFDSNNHYHVLMTGHNGQLVYATDITGKLTTRDLASGLAGDTNPNTSLAIQGNTLHAAFKRASDGAIYYIRGHINGTSVDWDSRVEVSGGDKTTSPSIKTAPDGTSYVAWSERDSGCADYGLVLRIVDAGGKPRDTIGSPVKDCNSIQARPSLAITTDGVVHMVFSSNSDIYYARFVNGNWVAQKKLADGVNPGLATDGTALYAVYGKGNVKFRRSLDGGNTWSNELTYGGDDSRADYGSVTWSATAKRAIVAWGDDAQDGDNQYDIWTREFVAATGESTEARQLTSGDTAFFPFVAAGPNYAGVAYHTKRVFFWRGKLEGTPDGTTPVPAPPTPSTCNGSVAIAGGAAYTTSTSVSTTITPTAGCTPTRMQVSVDTPITTATPIVGYNASVSTTFVDTGSCAPHSVYVRLYNAEKGGDPFSDTIILDNKVSASVKVQNPYMPGNTPVIQDGGPNNGDPNYTRNGQVYVSVTDVNDCAGIKNFNLTGGTAQTLTNGSYNNYVTLANGSQFSQVFVTDNAGNTQTFPSASQSFNVITDKDAPVLSGSPTVAGPTSTSNIIVPLTFSSVVVTDTTYTKNAVGKQFWGVWLANSHDPNVQDPAALNWQAVQVSNPDSTFSFQWSLFSGLPAADQVATKSYYVYVRFMDGAGNLTTQRLVSNEITLNPGYTQPKLNLPLTTR